MRRLPDAYKKFDLAIIKKLIDLNIKLLIENAGKGNTNLPVKIIIDR